MCGQSAQWRGAGARCRSDVPQGRRLRFIRGVGIEMCYGVAKVFKKNNAGNLKEWGIFTGFLAAVADA